VIDRVFLPNKNPNYVPFPEESAQILDLNIAHWTLDQIGLADQYDDYMKWEHREPLIIQHITSLDPDVMGISDFDISLIQKKLEKLGYTIYSE